MYKNGINLETIRSNFDLDKSTFKKNHLINILKRGSLLKIEI
jgi:hypothetical protein